MSADVFTAITTKELGVSKNPVGQQATVADPTGGTTTDAEARAAIVAIIDRLQAFGFIE